MRPTRGARLAVWPPLAAFVGLLAVVPACSGTPQPVTRGPTTPTPMPPVASTRTLVGAGDIAQCGVAGAAQTARLLDRIDGTVFTAGDNAYFQGSVAQFYDCYDPHWGRHKDRTMPTPGNHDYETAGGAGYYAYFGDVAAPEAPGYYEYTLGAWRIYSLNTVIDIGSTSAQALWLRRSLLASPGGCALVVMHHPLVSSGPNGGSPRVRDLWRIMYEGGVDVIVTGDDHIYERFAALDPDLRPDPLRGMRQFVVGTGGAELYNVTAVRPGSEVRGVAWGVIRFTLRATDYTWEFVPVEGATFRDTGSATCH